MFTLLFGVFVDNFLVLGLYDYVFFIFYSSFLLHCFIFPFIYFPFTLFVPHFASLVSLVFPCVIAFLRYLAYKYCCIPCFCTMPLRRVTVSDRNCLAV